MNDINLKQLRISLLKANYSNNNSSYLKENRSEFVKESNDNHFNKTSPSGMTGSSNTHGIKILDLIELRRRTPQIPYLFKGIKVGSFGFIVGSPKSGKTIFCENLAMSLAEGCDEFFGQPLIGIPQKVLFISLEEFWQQRAERNEKQSNYFTSKIESNQWGENLILVDDSFPRSMRTEEDWDKIDSLIKEYKPSVVFIDSLTRLCPSEIEDSRTATKVALRLREMAVSNKITLIVIHHTTKNNGKPITLETIAGSRVWSQEADFAIGVNKTINGSRYIKDVFFRYRQEDEEVHTFSINEHLWIDLLSKETESSLLSEFIDGRINQKNQNLIFDHMQQSNKTEFTFGELCTLFVNTRKMSRQTLVDSLKKLISLNLIYKASNGIYLIYKDNQDHN
jgi:KaiC/GvpD/RAD55 family RecA-like ATPase